MQVVPIAADGVRTNDGERFQHIAFVEHGARNGAHVHDDVVESALDGAVQIVADRILRGEACEVGFGVEAKRLKLASASNQSILGFPPSAARSVRAEFPPQDIDVAATKRMTVKKVLIFMGRVKRTAFLRPENGPGPGRMRIDTVSSRPVVTGVRFVNRK